MRKVKKKIQDFCPRAHKARETMVAKCKVIIKETHQLTKL